MTGHEVERKTESWIHSYWINEGGIIGFHRGSVVKNPHAVQESEEEQAGSLGQEDPLEEGMATHSRILAWKIPWTEEPGGLQSTELHRVNWSDLACMHAAAAAAKSLQSCPTLCDPLDGSPTGSPRPWDSPGKNTGVGCHFLLQCMKVKSEIEVTQSCLTLRDPMDCSLPGSSVHGIYPDTASKEQKWFTHEWWTWQQRARRKLPSFALLLLTFVVIRVWEKKQPPSGEESRSLRRQPQIS